MKPKVKIKICGMREAENIRQVADLYPDYMGFIFYEPSPRYVGLDFHVPGTLNSSINRVGVFVNQSEEVVKMTIDKHQLHFVQLHGDESPSFCDALKVAGVGVIKVFRVGEDFDFAHTKQFEAVADFFLFDTRGKRYGGNSIPFDWKLLTQYNQAVPFFLSGGISNENIRQLKDLSSMNIHALDINSGVEDRPGLKNVNKIAEIINQLSL